MTTLVFDDSATVRPVNDSSRWDNVIFKSTDPYDPLSWSVAIDFDFFGYDTSPFWDADGTAYIVGSHYYRVYTGLQLASVNLDTGEVLSEWQTLWNGTGGLAPEGPHIYVKDGYYYLLIAEGGTGLSHMVTMARSKSLYGPYESAASNPILTNANTTAYFQTVGHADLFQDPSGNWWGVALATRGGPQYINYPMGRETVLTAVTWTEDEFPVFTPIAGKQSGWAFPSVDTDLPGSGPFITDGDDIDFAPGSTLPAHFTYWRFPNASSFTVSPEGHPNSLQLLPSRLNLTGLNGRYAGPEGQTFVGRRQQDTLFTYSVTLDYSPTIYQEEAGVTVFLTQDHHLELGIVLLPANESTSVISNLTFTPPADAGALIPQIRYRGISFVAVPAPIIAPIPDAWGGRPLTFVIQAANETHYSFSVGPEGTESELQKILYVSNSVLSYGFTGEYFYLCIGRVTDGRVGTFVGVYATSNGDDGTTPAYVSDWKYITQGQNVE